MRHVAILMAGSQLNVRSMTWHDVYPILSPANVPRWDIDC